jgi:rSAM/selenodomain-associated transferase 1
MVKTRLAGSIASASVTELYRCLLADTLALATSLKSVEVAVMCPEADQDELAHVLGNTVRVVPQKGEGLAAGLNYVFQYFTAGERQHVIAFNSDSPHLPASILESAFEALNGNDMVVGPTEDGGYYLVGAKAAYPSLFNRDGLGTRNALEALLARARELQLSAGFTEPFYDVDVEGDLTRLAAELQIAPARAPRTAAWLHQWRR